MQQIEMFAMIKKWTVSYPTLNGDEERRVYVYLPTMYDREPQRSFPVLYMFDGQNVFFDEDATYGKSWGMSGYLDYTDTPLIVAAVECSRGANGERLSEYSPYDIDDPVLGVHRGLGFSTFEWYINTFKPQIDRDFRTMPGRGSTYIGGSSMGGLMSVYALLAHNDVFSRAAALSPSLWVDAPKLEYLISHAKLGPDTMLYIDYGSREMGGRDHMRRDFADVCSKIMLHGVHVTARIIPGGTHCEASWERQLPFVIHTLTYDTGR